jgi:hypothetical protein
MPHISLKIGQIAKMKKTSGDIAYNILEFGWNRASGCETCAANRHRTTVVRDCNSSPSGELKIATFYPATLFGPTYDMRPDVTFGWTDWRKDGQTSVNGLGGDAYNVKS